MKQALALLLLVVISFTSCKNNTKPSEENTLKETKVDSIPTLKGEFIYVADGAVLKGNDFIYGVKIDSMAEELAEKVKPLKREDFDMVPVIIKGKVKANDNEEGWDEVVEIREIIKVMPPTAEPAIKVQGNKEKTQ